PRSRRSPRTTTDGFALRAARRRPTRTRCARGRAAGRAAAAPAPRGQKHSVAAARAPPAQVAEAATPERFPPRTHADRRLRAGRRGPLRSAPSLQFHLPLL